MLLLLLQQQEQCCCFLLLFVIVCRMANFGADLLNLISVIYFSLFKRNLFFVYPLAVLFVAFTISICLRTSWVIAGMRGAKAGVSPRRRSPPCTYYVVRRMGKNKAY